MGYDINMHIEVKKDDRWHHFAAPHLSKYELNDNGRFFDFVAGIRNEELMVTKPRGLPCDMSYVTDFCYQQDLASFKPTREGWLSKGELELIQTKLFDYFEGQKKWGAPGFEHKTKLDFDLDLTYFHTLINGNSVLSHQGWDDVRLVFWFE